MTSKIVLLTLVALSLVFVQSFAASSEETGCLGLFGAALHACRKGLAGLLGKNANPNQNSVDEKTTDLAVAPVQDHFFAGVPTRMKSFAELNAFLHRHATEKVVSIIEFYDPSKPVERMFTQPRFFEIQAEKLKQKGYEHFYAIELSIDDLEDQQMVRDMKLHSDGVKVTIGDRWCDMGTSPTEIEDFLSSIPKASEPSVKECRLELKSKKLELKKTKNGVFQVHSFRELKKFLFKNFDMFRVLEIHFEGKKPGGFLASLPNIKKALGRAFVGAELDAVTFQEKPSLEKCEVKVSMVLVYGFRKTWWRIPPIEGARQPTVKQVQDFATKVMENGICGDTCAKNWREEHKSAGKLNFVLDFQGHD